MDVNLLKEELEVYCKFNGIKYKYIAEQIHTSESMLCHWRKGRKNLSSRQLEQLKILLGATV
jgi:DNA-binding transcriptional regulator YiaG